MERSCWQGCQEREGKIGLYLVRFLGVDFVREDIVSQRIEKVTGIKISFQINPSLRRPQLRVKLVRAIEMLE